MTETAIETTRDRVGIERLSVFGLPPVDFVNLAADLGCHWIGSGLEPMREFNPQGYPDWSLRTDAALRKETLAVMADRDVHWSLCEGFGLYRGVVPSDYARDFEIFHELGGTRINTTSSGRDPNRTADGVAVLADMAAEYDMEVMLEVGSGPLSDVTTAVAAIARTGKTNVRLLLDTMHFFRFGSTLEDLVSLDPSLIGYVQIADVPVVSTYATYMEEALYERLPPGAGELPLLEFLRLIPTDVVISPEIPQRSLAEAGEDIATVVGTCVAATRALLAQLEPAAT